MTDLRAAAQAALDALEHLDGLDTETECVTIDVSAEIAGLRAALAAAPAAPAEPRTLIGWAAMGRDGYVVDWRPRVQDHYGAELQLGPHERQHLYAMDRMYPSGAPHRSVALYGATSEAP